MESIANRIKKALDIRGMRQTELVEKTRIGKSSISTYISGAYEPKQRNIYKIAKALDVNEAWLMGHDVPMERKKYILGSELEEIIDKISKKENIPADLIKDAYSGNTEYMRIYPEDGRETLNYENLLVAVKKAIHNENSKKSKLRSVARLEESDLTEDEDGQISDFISYILDKRKKQQ